MAVLDASALIPLARVGELHLLRTTLDELRTTAGVRDEVLVDGKRGTAVLRTFLEDVRLHDPSPDADDVAALEGISTTDAALVLLAIQTGERLVSNDKALLDVARSHEVEGWWVTTVLLKATKEHHLSPDRASDLLYELVDEGMNLEPRVYTRLQREIGRLGE